MIDATGPFIPTQGAPMRVHLSSFHGPDSKTLMVARSMVERFPPQRFTTVDSPRDADVVLYLEDGYVGLTKLPELMGRVSAAPNSRHFMFSESDWPYPVLPGAYPSLVKATGWADSWSYLVQLPLRTQIDTLQDATRPRYLFSFLGRASTHLVRRKLLRLDSAHTPCLDLSDAPERLPGFDFVNSYIDLMRNSHFVLCPRGFGVSSIRIFEAMCLGRVPVIIGDSWREPPRVPWERFSVRIAEDRTDTIPDRLLALSHRAPEMGALAAKTFRDLYAPEVFLDRLLEFLCETQSREPMSLMRLAVRAVAALGWRELKTVAHQVRHRVP